MDLETELADELHDLYDEQKRIARRIDEIEGELRRLEIEATERELLKKEHWV